MLGLPAASYLDPEAALAERKSIFHRSWQFVCHVSDLPATGTAIRFDCAGLSAVVLRGRDGALHGHRNVCRHRGSRLVDGDADTGLAFCVDARLRCPYHGWNYDETGALVGVPESQHYPALERANMALQPVHVREWRGLVFVAFDKPELELTDGIDASAGGEGTSFAALRRLSEPRTHQLRADWKLACEHLLDVSHFAIARPALKPKLFDPVPYSGCGAFAVRAVSGMEHTAAASCWPARAYAKYLPTVATRVMEAIFVWPNVLLQFMPDQLAVVQVLPTATGTCARREVSYGVPDASGELRVARYASERVRRRARDQDTRILERLQEGLASSPADRTGLLAAHENGLHWFVERLRTAAHGGPARSVRRRRIRNSAPLPA